MAKVTIKQLADVVGSPLEKLLEQISDAGLSQKSGNDHITDHDKLVLLSYLRGTNDKQSGTKQGARRLTLKRKSVASPSLGRTVAIDVRKKRSKSDAKKYPDSDVITSTPASEQPEFETNAPKVFISYSYDSTEHIKWVEQLAAMLRTDGVDAILDKWYLHPGDPVTEFMEKNIAGSDFVLIICTEKYKIKSDKRIGGVGYEEAIISSDMFANANHRKYIPILRTGNYKATAPITLHSKKYIDLSNDNSFGECYRDLLLALYGRNPSPPPIGKPPDFIHS